MPRTAPVIDDTPSYKLVAVRTMDANGEKRSDSYQVDGDATALEIEAFIDALDAATNAVIYEVRVSDVYGAIPSTSDALDAVHQSVHDNIVILVKNTSNQGQDFFIPAPRQGLLVDNTSNPDPANLLLDAVVTSLSGIRGFFTPVSLRFTERREKNSSVPL